MALITKKIKGTEDVLPKQSYRWQFIENIMREESRAYGFKEIGTRKNYYKDPQDDAIVMLKAHSVDMQY